MISIRTRPRSRTNKTRSEVFARNGSRLSSIHWHRRGKSQGGRLCRLIASGRWRRMDRTQ
ncbi:hypothetical protein Kim5_PA00001 (plasmid) [Rhizobium sp. Kim5]|nr:hypothetical protein Kim5_PA00001 [Rhizobium sp. Kim5]